MVTDDVLTQAIREVRRVLRDDKENPRFIQTVLREGYRFVADVAVGPAPESSKAMAPAVAVANRPVWICIALGSQALASILILALHGARRPAFVAPAHVLSRTAQLSPAAPARSSRRFLPTGSSSLRDEQSGGSRCARPPCEDL